MRSNAVARPSLYGLTSSELAVLLGGSGRARAVWTLARAGRDPFAPGALDARGEERLAVACAALPLRVTMRERADCGTVKLGVALDPGGAIETVLIPQTSRTTVCVSSQVGCGRACSFCVTATMGLVRSLDAAEIVGQVKLAIDEALAHALPPVRNVVFMGLGEPLDNLAATRQAIAVMLDPRALALAPGNVTLSTVGTDPEAILALRSLPVRIAWSLHAADEAVRRRLVPTTRHPLAALRDAFAEVVEARRTTLFVEVALIAGVNDSSAAAEAMASFLGPLRERVRINLLPLNPGRSGLLPPPEAQVVAFRETLRARGYFCLIRRARGADRNAACGQLVTAVAPGRVACASAERPPD